jgi:hypothetical protein
MYTANTQQGVSSFCSAVLYIFAFTFSFPAWLKVGSCDCVQIQEGGECVCVFVLRKMSFFISLVYFCLLVFGGREGNSQGMEFGLRASCLDFAFSAERNFT